MLFMKTWLAKIFGRIRRPSGKFANVGNSDRIETDRCFSTVDSVQNCSWKFSFECPELWTNLQPTDDGSVRHCRICVKLVYLCHSESEVMEHAKKGNCVCFEAERFTLLGDVEERITLLGDVEMRPQATGDHASDNST